MTRADSGAAVTGASIQLIPADGGSSRTNNTDAEGRYDFSAVAAGDYRVTATASGLMSADATVMRPAGNGVHVHVGAGNNVENVDLTLIPRSAIVGVVLDESAQRDISNSGSVAR